MSSTRSFEAQRSAKQIFQEVHKVKNMIKDQLFFATLDFCRRGRTPSVLAVSRKDEKKEKNNNKSGWLAGILKTFDKGDKP